MKGALATVWAVSAALLAWTALSRSELILNILSAWLSCSGLAFSLWNLRVRRRSERLRRDLRVLKNRGIPGDFDGQDSSLRERTEDGIVEGLLTAGVGSIVAAVGQAIFIATRGP